MRTALAPVLALALLAAAPATAQTHRPVHAATPAGCADTDTALRCAKAATPAFAPDGSLVLAWTAGGRVMVARSADQGATLSTAVAVNPGRETLDDGGEARAAVAVDARGRVFVAYALRRDKGYTGTLMFTRSEDGGASFEAPRWLASDPASQRFPSMLVDPSGRLTVAWIDKRGIGPAKAQGEAYAGAALALAWSDDGGRTFTHEGIAADHSCECCRVAMAADAKGLPVLLWRHVFAPNIRDHAVMRFAAPGQPLPPVKIAEDDWRVDACPHHGPAMAVDGAGALFAAWYTDGARRQGLFQARAADGGAFEAPRAIGNPERAPSHPQLLALGRRIWLAWTEFDGQRSQVMVQASTDGGTSWSSPWALAASAGASDRPLLVTDGNRPFLSWLSRPDRLGNGGWRLIPVGGAP